MRRLPGVIAVCCVIAACSALRSSAQTTPPSEEAVPVLLDTGTLERPKTATLPSLDPITSMALSEDHRYLALASEEADQVRIFDAPEAMLLKKFGVSSPWDMLFRGGKLVVANHGHGSISVFDPAKGWQQVATVTVGHKNVSRLSAPQGRYFQGTVLAACEADEVPGELEEGPRSRMFDRDEPWQVISAVDIESAKARDVHYDTAPKLDVACDYMGDRVLIKGADGFRGSVQSYDFASLVAGRYMTRKPYSLRVPNGLAGSVQVAKGPYWFHIYGAFKGLPATKLPLTITTGRGYPSSGGQVYVAPDPNGRVFYTIRVDSSQPSERSPSGDLLPAPLEVICRRVDDPVTPIATWTVRRTVHTGRFDHAIAFTVDNVVRVYLYEMVKKRVTYFKVPAPTIPEAAKGGPAGFDLGSESPFLTYSRDGKSILWLDFGVLRVLNAAGTAEARSVPLPRCYKQLFERERYYVAVSTSSVDFLDKQTGRPYRQVPLGEREGTSLALHPGRPVAFIAATKFPQQGICGSKVVLQMDELKGTFEELPRVFGNWIAADPAGRYLVTAIHDRLHPLGPPRDWEHLERYSNGQSVDVLATFDVTGPKPQPLQMSTHLRAAGEQLAIAHDGDAVAYVGREHHGSSGTTVGDLFSFREIEKPVRTIRVEKACPCVSFHPVLDLLVFAGSPLQFFSRTGEPQEVSIEGELPEAYYLIKHVFFTPDGRHLLVGYQDPARGLRLKSFPLRLTPQQIAGVGSGFQPVEIVAAAPARLAVAPVGTSAFGAFKPIPDTAPTRTRGQVAALFRQSVVMIRTPGKVQATGMVIGSDGYILTTANVATPMGRPTVAYTTHTGETLETGTEVLRTDPEIGLAILKIEPPAPLQTIRFDRTAPVRPNQRVYVLEYRQPARYSREETQQVGSTTGLVYNPRLELSGRTFIQTSANVGGRSGGAPLFNTRGGVIGVILHDPAHFGASAMAIPLDKVVAFLQVE